MQSLRHFAIVSVAFWVFLAVNLYGAEAELGYRNLTESQIKKLYAEADSGNNSKKARKMLGIYFFQNKKYEKASEILMPILEGLDKQSIIILAKSLHQQKNYLNEIRVLEQWLSRNQKDFVAIKMLGDAYLSMGNRADAAKTYQLAIEVNKKYEPAYEALVEVNDLEGLVNENRSLILDMVRIFKEKPKYLHRLCEYYYADGFLREARNYCQRAVNMDAKFADSHVILGLTYKEEQNPMRYQKILISAAKQFPKSELAQFMAGEMSEQLRDFPGALKYFRQATIADSKSVRSWLKLGAMAVNTKNYEESLKAFDRACGIDRTKALESYRNVASSLRIQGINQWYRQFEAGAQKCKYQDLVGGGSRVKDFTIKESIQPAPVTEKENSTETPKEIPTPPSMSPLPSSGNSPDGSPTPTGNTGE